MTASKYAIFAKAVELGSFTNAAKALGCTQSGVSHAINALEDELGLKLILRSRAGLRLTADGERILPAVKAVLAASKELKGDSTCEFLDFGDFDIETAAGRAVRIKFNVNGSLYSFGFSDENGDCKGAHAAGIVK